MLTLISDLPAAVVGVEATGTVTARDYEQTLVPTVEAAEAASTDGKVRLLYTLGHELPDFSAGAAWQDAKLGLARLRDWERIAVVGDTAGSAMQFTAWAAPSADARRLTHSHIGI